MTEVSNKKEHLAYLDSVRGIAALMILFYHFFSWKFNYNPYIKLSLIFFNSDAVSFFFVLSGFVLSYKYITLKHELDIRKFYINRVLRLWPAFFITVFINALDWCKGDMTLHNLRDVFIYNKYNFWNEALLIRSHPQYYIPSWTLNIELIMSFFIPFMIALAIKNRRLVVFLLLAYLLMGIEYGYHIHFALGVLISCYFETITDASFRQSKWHKRRYILIPIGILLFVLGAIDRTHTIGGPDYIAVIKYLGINYGHFSALGAFVIIIAIIHSAKAKSFFNHSFLRFFGKISYGIYLMHWLIVSLIYQHWNGLEALFPSRAIAFIVMLLVCIGLTTILATILHYTVELPFIRLGKRITQKMKPSLVIK